MPATVRPARLWAAIRDRLRADARVVAVVPPARIVTQGETGAGTPAPSGDAAEAWARLVVVPVVNPFGVLVGGTTRPLTFNVRADVNDPGLAGFDPAVLLDAAHDAVFQALTGFAPVVPGCRVVLPIARETAPEAAPLVLDAATAGVLFTAATYRCEAVPAPLTA